MIKEQKINIYLKKHNYLLFSFLALGTVGFMASIPRATISTIQLLTFLSIGMLLWSIIHHFFDKTLHWEVMIEYLLIIALVLVIMYSFLA